MTTWRQELETAMEGHDPGPVVAVAPNEDVLDVHFNGGYGSAKGPDVLIWTERNVYFPAVYDGAEWLGSAPRNPQAEGQSHEGGQ
jgi:hypothetical protein